MQLNIRSGPDAGKTIPVAGEQFTVGRDASCDLTINDFKISRKHAYFKALPDGRAALHDLNSSNGTFVNGHKVDSALLSGGETIQFGDTQLAAVADSQAAAVGTAPAAAPSPPQAPPTQPLPPTGVQPPAQQPRPQVTPPRPAAPIGGPQRTQSAIQRVMLQRSVRRATVIGVAAIVLVLAVAGLFAFGVLPLDEGDDGGDSQALRPVRDVVREVTPSTIFIQALDETGSGGTGTGWVWDAEEGLVVTNAHVISDATLTRTLPDLSASVGTDTDEREVEVVYNATCVDLAVLRLDDTDDLRTLPRVEDQESLNQGDDVVAVGYPGTASEATQLVTNTGVISVVQSSFDEVGPLDPDYQNVVQTDTAINPGNSGGPLILRPEGDEPASLIGVNTLVRTTNPSGRDIQGQNYAIGVDRVNELVPEMIDGEDVCAGTPLPEPGTGAPDPNAQPLVPVPTGP